MIPRHEICHASEVVKYWNKEVYRIDTSISLLIDETMSGTPLNETLEQLQAWIATNCGKIRAYLVSIVRFINGWDSYDESQYTTLDYQDIINASNFINQHATDLEQDIFGPQITTKDKLAKLHDKYSNALMPGEPVVRTPEVINANRVNIYVDAAAHTLRNRSESDGVVLSMSDFAIRELTRRYLDKVKRIAWTVPLPTLQADVDYMVGVADYVLENLEIAPLTDLADFIDTEVPKTPLFRKLWLIP